MMEENMHISAFKNTDFVVLQASLEGRIKGKADAFDGTP
jgi:hypothetical protein